MKILTRAFVGAIVVWLSFALPSGFAAQTELSEPVAIQMHNLNRWAFEGGQWQETPDGLMQPPKKFQDYYNAFYLPKSFGNFEAKFDFRLEQMFCDTGFILHAQDAEHYYLVHFPTAGQQWRVKHFWVAVSRVGRDGYKHILKLAMVPLVNSNLFVWHQARVVMKGNHLQVWVDGHRAAEVTDPGFAHPGRVGIAGFNRFSIRKIEVVGRATSPATWPAAVHPVKNWFHPCPDATYGKWQYPPSIVRTPAGDLLMSFQATNASAMQERTPVNWVISRSRDGGRHWSKPELPVVHWPKEVEATPYRRNGTLFVTADHRLMFQDIVVSEQGDRIYMAESHDDGHTWGNVWQAKLNGEWPKDPSELYPYGPVMVLKDGTLLRMLEGSPRTSAMEAYEFDWGALQFQAFSIRSTDGGKSWSAPVDLDGSPAIPQVDKPRSTTLDLTESSCVQVTNGTVRCLIRPENSPFMWATESKDNGHSWGPTTFGPFPGYAANAFYTSRHEILVSHRMPDLAINVSTDDGLNWDQGTIVGTDIWAMGDMVQVAPHVVLFVYMDTQQGFLRAQFIRVTPHGLEPALDMLPKNQ